jgi:kynureninase
MITLTSPSSPEDNVLTTEEVLSAIDAHAADTALLLLPGIQYYTGALFDIPTITAHAHKHGIFVIWDLAHAVGNVPLLLHDWDVDAAAWCSYKYLNGGPGCIGGLFVHERNAPAHPIAGNRLAGWWGNDKKTRFVMDTEVGFRAVGGAAGFQLSNPSILDITSLSSSLELFHEAGGMGPLREKSLRLTGFLEELLLKSGIIGESERELFRIITPSDPARRGAQLSLMLAPGLLNAVMRELEARGVIVDERKPDVIRVAPAPLYNTFSDCVAFVQAFAEALSVAKKEKAEERK